MLWDTEEAQRIKENDSEFWDEVDERTPPPEDRNAGDIVDIIDTLVKERDHEGPININSNEVTADQANEWETITNIVGNDNVTDLSVDNKTTIDNENIFDVSDSEYSDGNAFNGNFTRLDVDQNNKWKTDLGVYGDGNITKLVEGLSSSDDTEPASYIRDESDIGTGFLERFKNKLLTKILDR